MATVEAERALTESSEAARVHPRLVGLRSIDLGILPYILPAGILYGLFLLWPMVQLLWLSLQRWDGYGPQRFIGLANFGNLAGDSFFRTALYHSILWEIAAAVLPTAPGLGLALLLRRSRVATGPLAVLFFGAFIPPTAVAAVWTLVYSPPAGLLNTVLTDAHLGGLASPWLGDPHLALPALFVAWLWSAIGVPTLVFWIGLGAIGPEYWELAQVEGAGPIGRLRYVILPSLRRLAPVAILVNTALAAQVFDLVYVTTGGGPGDATMLLSVDMYGRAFGGSTGQGAAVAVLHVCVGMVPAVLALWAFRAADAGMDSGEREMRSPVHRRTALSTGVAVLVAFAVVLPLLWVVSVALTGGGSMSAGVSLDPRSWDMGSFRSVWNAGMGGALSTSLLLALAATCITLLCAAPAAFALARSRKVAFVLTAGLLLGAGAFAPAPVLIVPLFSLLKELGLLNTAPGIVLPEAARALPFAVLLLWGYLRGGPRDVLEAAAVDGASPLRQMFSVALPLALPALLASGVWAFVASWNEYLVPTVVSQDGSLATVPTTLAGFIGAYNTQYPLLAAGTVLAVLPSFLVYVVLRRSAGSGLRRAWRAGR